MTISCYNLMYIALADKQMFNWKKPITQFIAQVTLLVNEVHLEKNNPTIHCTCDTSSK